jgi:cytochrome P450
LRKSENGISVCTNEYGSMNTNARELAAGFDIEKLTPEFYADPYPTYRALRENEPVKRLPNGSWFLTRYDDLVTAYKSTKLFSSDKKRSFCRNTALRCSTSTTPPASSSTTRLRIPGYGG